MRLGLVGMLAGCGLGLIALGGWTWGAMQTAPAPEIEPWQARELTFLKAAYDRMQADLAGDAQGRETLQAEQDRVVRRMAEIAELVPRSAFPAELRPLLAPAEGVGRAPPSDPSAGGLEDVPDLRVGLGGSAQPMPDLSAFAVDPLLRQPLPPPGPREHHKGRREAKKAAREAKKEQH